MRVDLPLLHALVPRNRLGIHRVEVVIRGEDRIGDCFDRVERRLADLEHSPLEPKDGAVIGCHILEVIP